MPLTVDAYNAAEAAAEVNTPNRIIEACRPETFIRLGYPTSVNADQAVWRFADAMHELRDRDDYQSLLGGGFTEPEFEIFKKISAEVASLTERRFGRRLLPKGALTRAFISFRCIRAISEPGTTVFEIGPGSGYLGALLGVTGFNYVATDVTQGFYIYQSILWEHLFRDKFIELATDPRGLDKFGALAPGTILHVPWWKYNVDRPQNLKLDAQVVTSNHALAEMHHVAFMYALKLSRSWLAYPGLRYFFIEHPGAELTRTREQIKTAFKDLKYELMFEEWPISVFATNNHGYSCYEARQEPAPEEPNAVASNLIAERLVANRSKLVNERRISFEAVTELQRNLMGGGDTRNPDECYYQYIFGDDYYS
jgi:hypothetical protein